MPVVTLICHGHHVNSPFWNLHDRGVKPTEAEFTLLFTPEDLKRMSPEELNDKLVAAFQYDDFAWQKERGIRTPYKGRAEGLHKVLYQCPACGREYHMASKGTELFCTACGKRWTMSELGELSANQGESAVRWRRAPTPAGSCPSPWTRFPTRRSSSAWARAPWCTI